MTVEELGREIKRKLSGIYGEGEGAAMTRLIFHALKGWDTTALIVHGDREASEWLVGKCRDIAARAAAGEPIQYILGEARFYGMDLKVAPGVLIPRPETAELVDLIVKENDKPDLRVLDVGTGSGAIAIALSRNLPFSRVTALDISQQALQTARENAEALHARIDFVNADIFTYEPAADSFDLIVSNPPYIAESEKSAMERNVLEHEPSLALFVPDENPLIYYSRIAEAGRHALVSGGRLYFEINPRFAEELRHLLERDGYMNVELHNDSYGRVRFAVAQKR